MKTFLLVVCLPVIQLVIQLGVVLGVVLGAPAAARADSAGPAAWPLQPQPAVVRGFDPPESPWGSGHRGVDLLGRAGQEVRAALAGTVSFAGSLAGRGVVVVDHGGTRTTYEPVEPTVTVGAAIATGGVIGHLQTGLSHCFPRACLHWGLLRGEDYLDPLSLLGHGPVRLLPLDMPGPIAGPIAGPLASPPLLEIPLFRPAGAPAGTPFAIALP